MAGNVGKVQTVPMCYPLEWFLVDRVDRHHPQYNTLLVPQTTTVNEPQCYLFETSHIAIYISLRQLDFNADNHLHSMNPARHQEPFQYLSTCNYHRLFLEISMVYYTVHLIHLGHGLSFPDWVSVLTLCFAPLIAHIVSGAPQPSYLYNTRPKWHERICHYNPTSIMWRYFSIFDRRLRSRKWSSSDLAASNTVFWTERGWDGSDQMITRSLPHCTYLPTHARAELFSDETFKSIITAVQGIQAVYTFILAYTSSADTIAYPYIGYLGTDQIFYPLAVLGLFRLFAAPWLSHGFKYTPRIDVSLAYKLNGPYEAENENRLSLDSLIHFPGTVTITEEHYHQVSCWRSRLFRTLYIMIVLGVWAFTILWIFPIPVYYPEPGANNRDYTATSLSAAIFYFILVGVSVTIHTYYFIRGETKSTVIPCACRLWYKNYTIILFVFMTMLFIVSLLETTKTVCGKYTSLPVATADYTMCSTTDSTVWKIDSMSNESDIIGFALRYPYAVRETVLKEDESWVRNVTATCLVRWSSNMRVHAVGLDVVDFTGINDRNNGTATEV